MSSLAAIPIIGRVLDRVFGIIDQAVPDKDLALQLKTNVQTVAMTIDHSEFEKEIEDRANARALAIEEAKTDVWFARLLKGTLRPVVAYAFTGIYLTIKITLLVMLMRMVTDFKSLAEGATVLWGTQDYAIMGGILGFYFGLRSIFDKRNGRASAP